MTYDPEVHSIASGNPDHHKDTRMMKYLIKLCRLSSCCWSLFLEGWCKSYLKPTYYSLYHYSILLKLSITFLIANCSSFTLTFLPSYPSYYLYIAYCLTYLHLYPHVHCSGDFFKPFRTILPTFHALYFSLLTQTGFNHLVYFYCNGCFLQTLPSHPADIFPFLLPSFLFYRHTFEHG